MSWGSFSSTACLPFCRPTGVVLGERAVGAHPIWPAAPKVQCFQYLTKLIKINNSIPQECMGNSNSSKQGQQPGTTLGHPRIREVKFTDKNEIMRASIAVDSQEQFNEWERRLSQVSNFDEYFLLLPKNYFFTRKAICGSSGVLDISYDNFPYLLNQEITNRISESNHFTEQEVWYLLYGLLSAAHLFSKIGTKVGDVCPSNIFLNEEGQIKIASLCSWPGEHSNYQKFIFEHAATYIAPEEVDCAKEGKTEIYKNNNGTGSCNIYKCESFSIGVSMLEAAILAPSSNLYQGNSINKEQLEARVTRLLQNKTKAKYSFALRVAIAALCEYKAESRLNSLDLYDQLKQFDSELSNLKACPIAVPQTKLWKKYQQIAGVVKPEPVVAHYTKTSQAPKLDPSSVTYHRLQNRTPNEIPGNILNMSPDKSNNSIQTFFRPTPTSSITFQQLPPPSGQQYLYSNNQTNATLLQNAANVNNAVNIQNVKGQLGSNLHFVANPGHVPYYPRPISYASFGQPDPMAARHQSPLYTVESYYRPPNISPQKAPLPPARIQINGSPVVRQADSVTPTFQSVNQAGKQAVFSDFSNYSTINKLSEPVSSADKLGDALNAFTPTHRTSQPLQEGENGTELLKKINQEILRSKEKFAQ